MPKRQNTPVAITPITDFESCQRARPLILRRFADILGVWEVCANKTCTRARGCQGDGTGCLRAFMQAIPDADRREIRYALDNRAAGLAPGEAMEQAQARVAGEIARGDE
ncbi:hypothetical protein [Bosea sp. MMO-172]|uniref:hypothetical protein n=1 Tax=Bosea sp. MMO-172 TaxID=3127885 RepID=UPI003016AAD8